MTASPEPIREAVVEAGCRSVYGKNWDGPDDKRPGEAMKQVWRDLVAKAQAPLFAEDSPLVPRAERDAYAHVLTYCVATLKQVPISLLPGKVDMMLISALDGPMPSGGSRETVIAAAKQIADRVLAEREAEIVRLTEEAAANLKSQQYWSGEFNRAVERADRLEEALQRILQWSEAYPTDIFTPPDYKAIHAILTANGLVSGQTLDGLSADCMRRATEGVGKIARAALQPSEVDHAR